MVKKTKKDISREMGIEVGSICGQYFLKLEHLHYGYWTGDIEIDVANLHIAQDEYAKFIISHIPDGVNLKRAARMIFQGEGIVELRNGVVK